jgi:hypothetical protein
MARSRACSPTGEQHRGPGRRHPRARTARHADRGAPAALDRRLPRRMGAALERDAGAFTRQRRPAAHALEALRQPQDFSPTRSPRCWPRSATTRRCRPNQDRDWLQDRDDAAPVDGRLLARAAGVGTRRRTPGPDRILEARETNSMTLPDDCARAGSRRRPNDGHEQLEARRRAFHCPPATCRRGRGRERPLGGARAGGRRLIVRLAVYAKLLGADDDILSGRLARPGHRRAADHAAAGGLAQVSLPTLRKRRDAAIARLEAATMRRTG